MRFCWLTLVVWLVATAASGPRADAGQRKLTFVSGHEAPATEGEAQAPPDTRNYLAVYVYDTTSRRGPRRITAFDGRAKDSPVWSPSGDRIAYLSIRWEPMEFAIFLTDESGGVHREIEVGCAVTNGHLSWSPDGGKLTFVGAEVLGAADQWLATVEVATGKVERLFRTSPPLGVSFSPDWRHVAFGIEEGDRWPGRVARFVLHIASVGGEMLAKAPLQEDRISFRAPYWWSPESDKVYFLRYDLADGRGKRGPTGVYDLASKKWATAEGNWSVVRQSCHPYVIDEQGYRNAFKRLGELYLWPERQRDNSR